MANNYFQFKEFIIYQDKCSMKVCTDACILGAWSANHFLAKGLKVYKCLDIGTGTGLLSLMFTQKTKAAVDAIELDAGAFMQARDNFERSEWGVRLRAVHADAKDFSDGSKYDFIICNPPFYEDDLLSHQQGKNVAKHSTGLRLDELIEVVRHNLLDPGKFAVLLPYHRMDYFKKIARANHFYPMEKLLIKATPEHEYFRGIFLFSQRATMPVTKELIIKNNEIYSEDFVDLMKDYYLLL